MCGVCLCGGIRDYGINATTVGLLLVLVLMLPLRLLFRCQFDCSCYEFVGLTLYDNSSNKMIQYDAQQAHGLRENVARLKMIRNEKEIQRKMQTRKIMKNKDKTAHCHSWFHFDS